MNYHAYLRRRENDLAIARNVSPTFLRFPTLATLLCSLVVIFGLPFVLLWDIAAYAVKTTADATRYTRSLLRALRADRAAVLRVKRTRVAYYLID